MTNSIHEPAETPFEAEIVSTRVFDVPRAKLCQAVLDPDLLARWWGPEGFTNTFHEFHPEPGGAWRYTMHAPDGTDYHNRMTFVEITAPERIVLQHEQPMHRFLLTMLFADDAGKTRLTWRMQFESVDEAAKVRKVVMSANEENFDRLAEVLLAR